MATSEPGVNPDALPRADPPRVQPCRVNGTTLHVEVRGSGPDLLIIHGGGEDAEVWRAVAERLEDFTVSGRARTTREPPCRAIAIRAEARQADRMSRLANAIPPTRTSTIAATTSAT